MKSKALWFSMAFFAVACGNEPGIRGSLRDKNSTPTLIYWVVPATALEGQPRGSGMVVEEQASRYTGYVQSDEVISKIQSVEVEVVDTATSEKKKLQVDLSARPETANPGLRSATDKAGKLVNAENEWLMTAVKELLPTAGEETTLISFQSRPLTLYSAANEALPRPQAGSSRGRL